MTKRLIQILVVWFGLFLTGFGQGSAPIKLQEVDGVPSRFPTTIKVTNGTLSCSGNVCTITIGTGTGNVSFAGTAPADNAIVRFDGTAGTTIQRSIVTIDDSGNILPPTDNSVNLGSSSLRWQNLSLSGSITDSSGNQIITVASVASAVNEFTFTNASTGNPAVVSTTGNDTDISFKIVPKGAGSLESTGPLILSGTGTTNFVSPEGSNLPTKINVPLFTLSAFSQVFAFGVNSASPSTARGLMVADARSSAHQPTIGVLSQNEQAIGGFSWEGGTTDFVIKITNNGDIYFISNTTETFRTGQTAASFSVPAVPKTNALTDLGTTSLGWRQLFIDQTITSAGTTGNQTINKAVGTVNIAATGTTVTVTSNKVTTSSRVFAIANTNDATCMVKNAVAAGGSFTVNMTAACTAETVIGWWVLDQ